MTGPASRFVLTNGEVFDGKNERLRAASVFVAAGRITEVSDRPTTPADGDVIDVSGKVVMPGLIDAHVHCYATSVNVHAMDADPPTLRGAYATGALGDMLSRGFTTVRDVGGADSGLFLALQRGHIRGPRLLYCGPALSQTGGHGDFRDPLTDAGNRGMPLCSCPRSGGLCQVVDGEDAVRVAVRENLRRGGSFIKFMGSGGVASTGDKLECAQFSDAEIRAIVDEVERHGAYCTAHIHPDAALKRAIELGVHCIEHGSLIEADTAHLAAERGVSIVPTLAAMATLVSSGAQLGLPAAAIEKLNRIKDDVTARLEYLRVAGVRIGFGTDLLGPLQSEQCLEWQLRSAVFSNFEMLVQATSANAEIVGLKDEIGTVAAGAVADLLVVNGNPLNDISVLMDDGVHITMLITGGEIQ